MAKLQLEIITQEKHLLSSIIDSVTIPTVEGEVTVLPDHIPLFTKLDAGEVIYRTGDASVSYVVSGGFMDVAENNTITLLVDSAIRSDQINLIKAQEAKQKAQELMASQDDQRSLLMAEAQLRRALIEIKIAQRLNVKQTRVSPENV